MRLGAFAGDAESFELADATGVDESPNVAGARGELVTEARRVFQVVGGEGGAQLGERFGRAGLEEMHQL